MERNAVKKPAFFVLFLTLLCVPRLLPKRLAQTQTSRKAAQSRPAEIQMPDGPIPTRVLLQSPAETITELQIICLFESTPDNTLHGSLVETNEKLRGLLDQVRKPSLFRGELGETVLLEPPTGSLGASKLLIIGLGDSRTFTPERMEAVGAIAYRESIRLGIAHPFFAPTVLDGGVTKYTTGQASEKFIAGFLRAARTEQLLKTAGTSQGQVIRDLTYLAGQAHAADTQQGIERGFAGGSK
jgi:hypothetical protein